MTDVLVVDDYGLILRERLIDGMNALGKAFASLEPAVRELAQSFQRFGNEFYGLAEPAYLSRFGKLPGSLRTKRLRKKRQRMVVAWFMGELEQYREEHHGH